jgi:hypothetical protein
MAKYRLLFKFRPARCNWPKLDSSYDIERKDGWFSWEHVGSRWFNEPLEAAQFEDKLNNRPVRTGEFFG